MHGVRIQYPSIVLYLFIITFYYYQLFAYLHKFIVCIIVLCVCGTYKCNLSLLCHDFFSPSFWWMNYTCACFVNINLILLLLLVVIILLCKLNVKCECRYALELCMSRCICDVRRRPYVRRWCDVCPCPWFPTISFVLAFPPSVLVSTRTYLSSYPVQNSNTPKPNII